MRASRWNGKKIDHVSHLNNISGTTAKSRGERQLMFIGFFFFSSTFTGLRESKESVVAPCLHKKGEVKREKEGNEKHGQSGDGKTRSGGVGEAVRTDGLRECLDEKKRGALERMSRPRQNLFLKLPTQLPGQLRQRLM